MVSLIDIELQFPLGAARFAVEIAPERPRVGPQTGEDEQFVVLALPQGKAAGRTEEREEGIGSVAEEDGGYGDETSLVIHLPGEQKMIALALLKIGEKGLLPGE